jgi:3-phenylpropionate/cinnamic acid dioxygenase small subunit
MSQNDSLSDIRQLLAEYCQLLDDGHFDQWIDLFTTDIEFAVMGQLFSGREATRGFIEPSQQVDARGKHMISEPLITVEGDTATATTDYAFVSRALVVTSCGRYHDNIVRQDDRWRFARREIVFLGDEPIGR